jgi:hypothetical protein
MQHRKVIIRPTIPSDLSAVTAEPLPYRIRAYTAALQPSSPSEGEGETVLGVGGLAFPADGPPIAFVQQALEAKKYPLSFHRGRADGDGDDPGDQGAGGGGEL